MLSGLEGLTWPVAIAFAWVLGEAGHRALRLPRISVYGLVGFGLAYSQIGFLPRPDDSTLLVLANIGLGLILFEFGYRINLHWLRANPWIGVSGVVESLATLAAVYALAIWQGMAMLPAFLLASLAMATSPAEVLRVVNEQRSSGQVTDRALHLSALNCVLAVFLFNVAVGLWTFDASHSLLPAVSHSLVVLVLSGALGTAAGYAVPAMMRWFGDLGQDATIAFAVVVILLVSLAHWLAVSPVLAALTFGLVARHRRATLSSAQRNFGVLGDLLTVLLFVFVSASLSWPRVLAGGLLALSLVGVRLATKVIGSLLFARFSGISWRKGALTGLALAPMSVLVSALLIEARHGGINLLDVLTPMAAAALLMEVLGPVLTQLALHWAHESRASDEP
ncbi:MAG: cation:proton antiporter [Burkholderiales bacterium]|nr:cation:proton antiporter [Burkholderiales bacterium]